MGLLTILKKMKHKEREMRLLMLYPCVHPMTRYCGYRCNGDNILSVVFIRGDLWSDQSK